MCMQPYASSGFYILSTLRLFPFHVCFQNFKVIFARILQCSSYLVFLFGCRCWQFHLVGMHFAPHFPFFVSFILQFIKSQFVSCASSQTKQNQFGKCLFRIKMCEIEMANLDVLWNNDNDNDNDYFLY